MKKNQTNELNSNKNMKNNFCNNKLCKDKHFLNMQTFRFLGDICTYHFYSAWRHQCCHLKVLQVSLIPILFSRRSVLMNTIPDRHFLSHNSGNILCATYCTDSWLALIKEYVMFFITSRLSGFYLLYFLQLVLVPLDSLSDFEK